MKINTFHHTIQTQVAQQNPININYSNNGNILSKTDAGVGKALKV
jgi:hypothetical protein